MEKIFGNIYYFFQSFFGQGMVDFMWGLNCEISDYKEPVRYNTYGIYMSVSVILIAVLYYFVLSYVKLSKWWIWLIIALLVGIGNGVYSYYDLNWLYENGDIQDCHNITIEHLRGFAIANTIVTVLSFTIVSFLFKRFSSNGKNTPWPSIWPKH